MEEIHRFEKEISDLGNQPVTELQSIEGEYKAWWKKKQ
jgi:hypothetical protein